MKNNILRSVFCLLLCSLLLSAAVFVPCHANSAQTWFFGVDATGAIMSGDSPIVVEHERLTFDISEFPTVYGSNDNKEPYSASVSAEYTFYNPSDYTVTARLLFPFGNRPGYSYAYDEADDTERFDVTVNGEPIEKTVRYTLSDPHAQFELDRDLALLSDGYVSDGFYRPDLTVQMYVCTVEERPSGDNDYHAISAAFDIPKGLGNSRIYFPEQNGLHIQDDGDARLSCFLRNKRQIILYVIGDPPDFLIDWRLYRDGGVRDGEELGGDISVVSSTRMTLEEFALSSLPQGSSFSEMDWYNAVVAELRESGEHAGEYPYVMSERLENNFERNLMRWYEYKITLAPGERIVNTVTAPMYPAIDMGYEPDIYEYTYLLSPAKTWSSFGTLEIVINTPYYITESSIGGFSKVDGGYALTLDGLPDGELEFTLSESETPEREKSPYDRAFTTLLVVVIAVIAILILIVLSLLGGIVVAIVFICRAVRRRKKKE